MKCLVLFFSAALACQLAATAGSPVPAGDGGADGGPSASGSVTLPPVLRSSETTDNQVITLPGAAPAAPRPAPAEAREKLANAAPVRTSPAAAPQAPKRIYPAGFEKDSASFCQAKMGQWKESDARALLGTPSRRRAAADDDTKSGGHIVTFSDATGRYKELELDFAKDTGRLRSVFVYPWKMTWPQCRLRWGDNVTSTEASKGRVFYSYVERHLDVLVDPAGKVISIGLY